MVKPPRVPVRLPEVLQLAAPDLHHYPGLYQNVSPHPGNRTYRGKIVALVPKSAPEKMAELFILEKVHPISGNLET